MSVIPPKIRKEIEAAIRMKAKAKAMEEEAKALNTQAKEVLVPLMASYEIGEYAVAKVGTAFLRVNRGSAINAPKLRENMLLAGVSSTKTERIISRSTNTWESEYVEFKRTA